MMVVLFGVPVPVLALVFAAIAGTAAFMYNFIVAGFSRAFGYGFSRAWVVLATIGGVLIGGYLGWLIVDPVHLWPGLVIIIAMYLGLLGSIWLHDTVMALRYRRRSGRH